MTLHICYFIRAKACTKLQKCITWNLSTSLIHHIHLNDDHKYQRESQNLYEELNNSKFSSAKIKQMIKKVAPNSLINLGRNFLEKKTIKNEERANWFANNTGDNCYIRGILKKKI